MVVMITYRSVIERVDDLAQYEQGLVDVAALGHPNADVVRPAIVLAAGQIDQVQLADVLALAVPVLHLICRGEFVGGGQSIVKNSVSQERQ
jgi:hypothetical protein